MSVTTNHGSPFGLLGVFLVMLGIGVVLDGDWWIPGGALMTAGVWCLTIATIVYFSVQGYSLFLHAVLITLFVALTAPVTTIFLMRAALFRERQKGGDVPPAADD